MNTTVDIDGLTYVTLTLANGTSTLETFGDGDHVPHDCT
jgi:hypothetical protein